MTNTILPSIWLGEFSSKAEFDRYIKDHRVVLRLMLDMDDRLISDRHCFNFNAWCAACEDVTSMLMTWRHSSIDGSGSVQPAWTEVNVCHRCGLNSRMRALIEALTRRYSTSGDASIYLAESVTPAFSAIKARFPNVVGSEYLGKDYKPGDEIFSESLGRTLRHEDMTCLSFPDQSFDLVITQDVFEHIPDYQKAFIECARILKPGGRLLFTIPFFSILEETRRRASIGPDGSLLHIEPPEIHGNPVNGEGSLCFQNFGWSILDNLKAAGFKESKALLYWGPWAGHMGGPFFVFSSIMPMIISG